MVRRLYEIIFNGGRGQEGCSCSFTDQHTKLAKVEQPNAGVGVCLGEKMMAKH